MNPVVSVAIPSLNQSNYLQSALDSLYAQAVPLEICVADGGSVDGTLDILEANKNKLYWYQSKKDRGQSSAINLAASKGTARYIYWLNSDDEIVQDALTDMVSYLELNPNVPAVYGKAIYIDDSGKKIGDYFTQIFTKANLSRRCFICQPAVLIRRSVWEDLGGVDESLEMSMDYDFWWRIFLSYGKFGFLDKNLAKSRLHNETKTSQFKVSHYRESIALVRKHAGSIPWFWSFKMPFALTYDFVKKTINFGSKA